MVNKLRTVPGTATTTIGGVGPFVGDFVVVRNAGLVTALIGGDDEGCHFPVLPGEIVRFPVSSDSQYIYFVTQVGSTDLYTAGVVSV